MPGGIDLNVHLQRPGFNTQTIDDFYQVSGMVIGYHFNSWYIQWLLENSERKGRPLESRYNLQKSNKHETQQLCSANRSISLN